MLLASLLGARLLVTHRTVSTLLPAPSHCYVLTPCPQHHSSLTSLSLFPSRAPSSRSLACLASVSRIPFLPSPHSLSLSIYLSLSLSFTHSPSPLFRACGHPPSLSVSSRAARSRSGVLPFFFLSLLNVSGAWCEDGQSLSREGVEGGEASDVAGGGGKKVKEEEMEKEKKEEAIREE